MATPNWLRYANQGATRNQPLSPRLIDALSFLDDMGITAEVFSGGQPVAGGGPRVGSTRHDKGEAGDMFFFKDGQRLDWNNPNDLPVFQEIVRRGREAGLTGFGAGPGYMRPGSMHVGFGDQAVWGAGGRSANAPDWMRSAYDANEPFIAPSGPPSQTASQAIDQATGAPEWPPGLSAYASGQPAPPPMPQRPPVATPPQRPIPPSTMDQQAGIVAPQSTIQLTEWNEDPNAESRGFNPVMGLPPQSMNLNEFDPTLPPQAPVIGPATRQARGNPSAPPMPPPQQAAMQGAPVPPPRPSAVPGQVPDLPNMRTAPAFDPNATGQAPGILEGIGGFFNNGGIPGMAMNMISGKGAFPGDQGVIPQFRQRIQDRMDEGADPLTALFTQRPYGPPMFSQNQPQGYSRGVDAVSNQGAQAGFLSTPDRVGNAFERMSQGRGVNDIMRANSQALGGRITQDRINEHLASGGTLYRARDDEEDEPQRRRPRPLFG